MVFPEFRERGRIHFASCRQPDACLKRTQSFCRLRTNNAVRLANVKSQVVETSLHPSDLLNWIKMAQKQVIFYCLVTLSDDKVSVARLRRNCGDHISALVCHSRSNDSIDLQAILLICSRLIIPQDSQPELGGPGLQSETGHQSSKFRFCLFSLIWNNTECA